MLHLLKIEWLKIKDYKAFWIFMGLYVLGLFSVNYIAYEIQSELKRQLPVELFPYAFPKVWQTIGWISSWLIYFPGMLMVLLVTNEFTYKTHRQNIIDGLTRTEFISVKIVIACILAFITTIFCALNALFFGNLFGSTVSFEGSEFLLYTFVQSLNYLLFALLLAFVFRRSGLALIIFFLYGLLFEQLIGGLINKYLVSNAFYYFPLQSSDLLVPVPFGKGILFKDSPDISLLITVSIVYITLYCWFAIRKFKKENL